MAANTDAETIAAHCRGCLSLDALAAPVTEYGYPDLPLCVLDAVWSIGVRYGGVQNVVARYRAWDGAAQTVSGFVSAIEGVGVEAFAADVVQNRQRTSATGGILKAEAVLRWARVLHRHGIETLAEVSSYGSNAPLERDLRRIPGQRSGISLRYFAMLCGDETLIKPDRMTARFLQSALGRPVSLDEMQALYAGACAALNISHPALTPRRLDNAVWNYQRTQPL